MVCNYIYLTNKTSDYIVPLTTKMIVFDELLNICLGLDILSIDVTLGTKKSLYL